MILPLHFGRNLVFKSTKILLQEIVDNAETTQDKSSFLDTLGSGEQKKII
jgi:hypothetical protein